MAATTNPPCAKNRRLALKIEIGAIAVAWMEASMHAEEKTCRLRAHTHLVKDGVANACFCLCPPGHNHEQRNLSADSSRVQNARLRGYNEKLKAENRALRTEMQAPNEALKPIQSGAVGWPLP